MQVSQGAASALRHTEQPTWRSLSSLVSWMMDSTSCGPIAARTDARRSFSRASRCAASPLSGSISTDTLRSTLHLSSGAPPHSSQGRGCRVSCCVTGEQSQATESPVAVVEQEVADEGPKDVLPRGQPLLLTHSTPHALLSGTMHPALSANAGSRVHQSYGSS